MANPYDQFDAAQEQTSQANPYDQFTANNQAPSAAPVREQSNGFLDGVEAFNRQFGRMSEGVMQLIGKATGWQSLEDRVRAVHDANEASYQQAAARSPIATTVGNVLGAVGSATAYGGPVIGSGTGLAGKAIAGGLSTGLQNFAEYAETPEERLNNTITGLGVGAVLPIAGAGIGAGLEKTGKAGKAVLDATGGLIDRTTGLPISKIVNGVINNKNVNKATNDVVEEMVGGKPVEKVAEVLTQGSGKLREVIGEGTQRAAARAISGYLAPMLDENK
jgi:hypothetical protein